MDASEEHAENKIKDLPSDLQHSYQRMIEEINQLTANADDLTAFCNGIVNGIQNILEYYSVNLYIVDSERKWAVLKAGTSDNIKAAIQRGHKHAIDGISLVSRVINTHSPCVGQIAPEDPSTPFPSVDLPPVHSELCVPLISQQKNVVGVLDIQSEEYKAFQKEDFIFYFAVTECIINLLEEKKLL